MSRNSQRRGKAYRGGKRPDSTPSPALAPIPARGVRLTQPNRGTNFMTEASRMLNSAFAAEKTDNLKDATNIYRKLTQQFPDFAPGWHYYGLMLHRQNKSDQALDLLYEAHKKEPENPLFLSNVALVLWEMGEMENSLRCVSRAHELDPDHAQIFMQLAKGMIATEQGDRLIPEVERHLKKAPKEWRLWTTFGKCQEQGGDHEGAIAAYTQAATLCPVHTIEPLLLRGNCFQKTGKQSEAQQDYETILRTSPESGKALSGLATLASDKGDFEAAESLARKALNKEPELYPMWGLISLSHPQTPENEFRKQLEDALEQAPKGANVAPLHFALGKIWEKLGDYDQSFSHYREGNELRGRLRPYSLEGDVVHSKGLIEHLDEKFLARSEQIKTLGTGAIFICGMPRSGTTLVETILGSHPDVNPGGEQRYIHNYFRRTLKREGMPELGSWLQQADDEALAAIAGGWAKELREKAEGAQRITDKMPGNYLLLALIYAFFPDAHIIHVQRDPRDNCFSCYATPFSEGHAFSYRLDTLGRHYRLYQDLMGNWREVLGKDKIIEVNYEALTQNPDREIRCLLEALNLDWEPRCLEFHKSERNVHTASKYQVRQPMYKTSINRWKNFERHLKPLLDALEDTTPIV